MPCSASPRLILGVFVLALAACGTSNDVTRYTLPKTAGGRVCIEQCRKSRSYCGWSCDLDYRACFADEQAAAQKAFERYADQNFAKHVPNTRMPSDFEHREKCETEKKQCQATCATPYNACYTSCGGIVTLAD